MSDPSLNFEKIRNRFNGDYKPTDRQILFAYYYAQEGNGMLSIRLAGFNHSTAGSQSSAAYRLLKKHKIIRLVEYFKGLNKDFD